MATTTTINHTGGDLLHQVNDITTTRENLFPVTAGEAFPDQLLHVREYKVQQLP